MTSKLLCILGTRPEAIKLAPVILALAAGGTATTLCSTGQHRDLTRAALGDFDLAADVDLDLMTADQTPAGLIAAALPPLMATIARCAPDLIVVQGDTASTLAGALAASYARVPVAHVEAGLRSGSVDPFPEDLHRRLVAQAAAYHFAPTHAAAAALVAEGVSASAIAVTGNTVIDAVRLAETRLAADAALRARTRRALPPLAGDRPLIVVTAHRRENHARMPAIAAAVAAIAAARAVDIVVSLHPHPAAGAVLRAALADVPGVTLIPPLDYLAFVMLLRHARARPDRLGRGAGGGAGARLPGPRPARLDRADRRHRLRRGAARRHRSGDGVRGRPRPARRRGAADPDGGGADPIWRGRAADRIAGAIVSALTRATPPRRSYAATAPSPAISATNPGKLVAIGAASSTMIAARARRPSTAKLIAMRWSSRAATVAPPGTGSPPRPWTISPSGSSSTRDAARGQPRRHHRDPVAFLDAQFADPAHRRRAVRERGGDEQDGKFVDHARRDLGRHVDAGQVGSRSRRRSATGSPPTSRAVRQRDVGPHQRAARAAGRRASD